MLGVSKYKSTTIVLGEIGRYPVPQKAIRQTIFTQFYMHGIEWKWGQITSYYRLQKAFTESLLKSKSVKCQRSL